MGEDEDEEESPAPIVVDSDFERDSVDEYEPQGTLIGPVPPKTALSVYSGSVGNTTLWGNSMPVEKEAGMVNMGPPSYDDSTGGVDLDEAVEIHDQPVFVGQSPPEEDDSESPPVNIRLDSA